MGRSVLYFFLRLCVLDIQERHVFQFGASDHESLGGALNWIIIGQYGFGEVISFGVIARWTSGVTFILVLEVVEVRCYAFLAVYVARCLLVFEF